ncbi:MarR family transcriptional regulator [Rhodococcus aerolatus]
MTEPTEGPVDVLALERQLCFALAVAQRSVLGVYKPLLAPLGLTHPQYLVMLALWEHAPLPAGRLAALLQQHPATLSPLLQRLEAADLVTRTRSVTDERVLEVDVTPAGAALRDEALAVPPAVVARLGVPLSALEALHAALTDVNAAALAAATED